MLCVQLKDSGFEQVFLNFEGLEKALDLFGKSSKLFRKTFDLFSERTAAFGVKKSLALIGQGFL